MPLLPTLAALVLLTLSHPSPEVVYGTYLGGHNKDGVSALAIDLAGNAWVIGSTPSPDFPVTQAAFKSRASVNNDDFVGFATKLSPAGDRVVYSTFVGGSWRSSANAIAIEASGGAVIVGSTCSPDFPVTANALQHKPGRGGGRGLEPCDGYVSKLDPSGSRAMYATYLGGIDADSLNAVALNDQSEAVVAGWTRSPDLLGTTSRGESDALVALLGPQGNLVWIRRFGGSGADWFSSVVTGGDGTILAAGISDSTDLPCSGPLPQRPYGFVLAFRGAADDPVCSRFAGQPAAMALDDKGHVYVAGSIPFGGRTTGFVLRLTLTGRHIDWYRRLGGSDETRISGITAGLPGSLFVCGSSYSRDFPVTAKAMALYPGRGSDMMLLRLSTENGSVAYGTFLAGNATPEIAPPNNTAVSVVADGDANVWIAGNAIGHPRWISQKTAQGQSHGNTDVFVLKLKFAR